MRRRRRPQPVFIAACDWIAAAGGPCSGPGVARLWRLRWRAERARHDDEEASAGTRRIYSSAARRRPEPLGVGVRRSRTCVAILKSSSRRGIGSSPRYRGINAYDAKCGRWTARRSRPIAWRSAEGRVVQAPKIRPKIFRASGWHGLVRVGRRGGKDQVKRTIWQWMDRPESTQNPLPSQACGFKSRPGHIAATQVGGLALCRTLRSPAVGGTLGRRCRRDVLIPWGV